MFVESCLGYGSAIFWTSVASQRDEINPVSSRAGAHLPGDLVTIHSGQTNIHQRQVELFAADGLQSLVAVNSHC